jgi:hypothetical protein
MAIARANAPKADIVRAENFVTSCDQAIFVDQATDASLFTDAVLDEIDRFG